MEGDTDHLGSVAGENVYREANHSVRDATPVHKHTVGHRGKHGYNVLSWERCLGTCSLMLAEQDVKGPRECPEKAQM